VLRDCTNCYIGGRRPDVLQLRRHTLGPGGDGVIFAFFGVPGAGKTTLCNRFGALHGLPAIDTDAFMLPAERAAAAGGWYTQQMRLANIDRYTAHLRQTLPPDGHAALADGLPAEAARRYLLSRFPNGGLLLVLVETPRAIWESRLRERRDNPVELDTAAADAYIAQHWQPPLLPHERIENAGDSAAVDAQLRALFARWTSR
jgi:predicted kinase